MDHSSNLALIHAGEFSVGMESQDCLGIVNGAVQQPLYCKERKRTGAGTKAVVVLEALCWFVPVLQERDQSLGAAGNH